MHDLLERVASSRSVGEVCALISPSRPVQMGGLYGSSAACLAAALVFARRADEGPLLFVAPTVGAAEEFYSDLSFFTEGEALFFSAWEADPRAGGEPNPDIFSERFEVVHNLVFGRPRVIVTSIGALVEPVPRPDLVRDGVLAMAVGEEPGRGAVISWLVDHGFERATMVEMPGEFSVRGGIIDVFPYSEDKPWRIEFLGDRLESIRRFDAATQASVTTSDTLRIAAVNRTELFRAAGGPDDLLLLDYLAGGRCLVVLHELGSEGETGGDATGPEPVEGVGDAERHIPEVLREKLKRFSRLYTSSLPFVEELRPVNLAVKSIQRFATDFDGVPDSLRSLAEAQAQVFIVCHNEGEAERLAFFAGKAGVEEGRDFHLKIGHIHAGFELIEAEVLFIGYQELFNRYRQARRGRRYKHTRPLEELEDLATGELVVHSEHGIGRYCGLKEIRKGDRVQEYLAIEYRDGLKLYVPAINAEVVQRYVGVGGQGPQISKIGGTSWKRQKVLAEGAAFKMAAEFLQMQAIRQTWPGISYPSDDELQHEFDGSFIYEETPDQASVGERIAADMFAPRPMDRLLCGDVGYGKTELAMRAAFRAVRANRQVAVLVPTTILAQQHYQTFTERMADYPVNVGVISRFKTRAEQREILEKTEAGAVDVLIGTHRLIQDDVRFCNLGLVIIDEEQRFGVEHKEKLKRLRATVDVLTLTATPIPRTLHQTLLGVRDISNLSTPPADRLSIETQVCRWEPGIIREAILRELYRNGQVYFVHNRVCNIEAVAAEVARIVPEATIGTVHGQMPEHLIEERMVRFTERHFDVLVTTTIIESGLDIPNANTLFVSNADTFGLADLHQLRGRVGRYKHKAYAYFLLPRGGTVTAASERRLRAIEELNQLGAGYRIALRDLEIRGAGNLLGREQSGHIQAIGYHMYCRLLKGAVERLRRGTDAPPDNDITIDIQLDAYLPDDYVATDAQKLEIYRKLSSTGTSAEIEAMRKEMTDRFGPCPPPVERLIGASELRLLARSMGVVGLGIRDQMIYMRFLNAAQAEQRLRHLADQVRMVENGTVGIRLPRASLEPSTLLKHLKNLLQPDRRAVTIQAKGG